MEQDMRFYESLIVHLRNSMIKFIKRFLAEQCYNGKYYYLTKKIESLIFFLYRILNRYIFNI